jgi:hypothetical protein
MTDPIGSMLIMIKNAGMREHASISVPFSKLKQSIAECLMANGYVDGVSKKTKKGTPMIEVSLTYKDVHVQFDATKPGQVELTFDREGTYPFSSSIYAPGYETTRGTIAVSSTPN